MSAKRRQEAIAEFSVPLEEGTPSVSAAPLDGEETNDDDDDDDYYETDQPTSSVKHGKYRASAKSRRVIPKVMLISLKAVSGTT